MASRLLLHPSMVNTALSSSPPSKFQCCKLSYPEAGPQHTTTFHIGSESMEVIGSACQDAWNGLPSRRPVMEMTIPSSLDRTIAPPGGNIFHDAMGLDSLFLMRPVKGWSDHRTPVRGLYICGSGSHLGGGVMGARDRKAAHVVLQDFRK